MEDDEDDAVFEEKPCPAKLSRKVGEKLRRDRLNSLITQLAEEIPIIKYAHRRLDKSAILRLTVSYLKLHQGLKRKKLSGSVNFQGVGLLNWLKKVTNDVLLILAQSGTIIYVSAKIVDMLGFYQTDMVGHNIKRFVHPDDFDLLMSQFNDHIDVTFRSESSKQSTDRSGSLPSVCGMLSSECKSFCIRMLKAVRRKQMIEEPNEYEMVCFQANCENRMDVESTKQSDELWMLALLKPFSTEPVREVDVKISEFMKNNEWASMHDINSQIIACDQRSSLFHGYLVSEVLGKTPYMLICEDDLESVALSHQMIMKNHKIPSTVFRMNNKFDMTIYIQSESIIVKDRWTKQPKCIVSVNRVLSSEEGKYLLDTQKKRTDEFIESKKRDVEKIVKVKQEVDCEDYSCEGHCQQHSESSQYFLLQSKETGGKNLKEIYDKESQNFPGLYVAGESWLNAENASEPEKRTFECIDSDSSGLDSTCSTNTLSDSSGGSGREEESLSPKYKSPSLKDLLSDEMCFKKASIKSKSTDSSKCQETLPLLKGILQGNLEMTRGQLSSVTCMDNDKRSCRIPRKIHVGGFISASVSGKDNGAACVPSVQPSVDGADCHAAAGHSAGVQSPTVGSSELVPVASAAESSNEPCNVRPSVYSRFTSQLVKKHSMLKQTIESQKLTLEVLKDQLQNSHNNVVLSSQQKKVHDSLIDKITEAEDQVTVQCDLLQELEEEILEQQVV